MLLVLSSPHPIDYRFENLHQSPPGPILVHDALFSLTNVVEERDLNIEHTPSYGNLLDGSVFHDMAMDLCPTETAAVSGTEVGFSQNGYPGYELRDGNTGITPTLPMDYFPGFATVHAQKNTVKEAPLIEGR
jgi:hypothetical protein